MKGLTFLESTHQYFYEGKELVSVTYAFEKIGITDFSRVPFHLLEPARIKGDAVHHMAALYAIGLLDEASVEPEYQGYLEAIKKFFREEVKEILQIKIPVEGEDELFEVPAVEQPIFNAALGYAGTPDLVYLNRRGKICLDDFKTPLKEHKATKWQTAAYTDAFQRIHKVKIDERHGVRLGEKGDYHLDAHTNPLRRDLNNFITILRAAVLKIQEKIN